MVQRRQGPLCPRTTSQAMARHVSPQSPDPRTPADCQVKLVMVLHVSRDDHGTGTSGERDELREENDRFVETEVHPSSSFSTTRLNERRTTRHTRKQRNRARNKFPSTHAQKLSYVSSVPFSGLEDVPEKRRATAFAEVFLWVSCVHLSSHPHHMRS